MRNPILILSSILLLAAAALRGQETRKLSFDLYAGPTLASVKPDPDEFLDAKYRTGFFAGAQLRLALSEKLALPIAVQYSQRGFYYNSQGTFIVQDGQLALYRGRIDGRLGYIDIAPQLEFQPISQLGVALGPYLSYRLSEEVRYGDVIDWTSTKDTKLYKDTDLGLTAKITGSIGPVFVFAAYQFGLLNISDKVMLVDENGQPIGELGFKNRALFFGVGWRI